MNGNLGWWLTLGVAIVGAGSVAGGCGGGNGNSGFDQPGAGGADGGGGGDSDTFGNNAFGDGSATQGIVVTPANPVIDVTAGGPPATQQFQAHAQGQSTPLTANWSIDNVAIGTIDATGLFTGAATGGQATVTAQSGALSGTTTVTVHLHVSENPGNVDHATQAKLKAGGAADSAFAWLYPYDKTVFPRGLLPPTLQFGGTAPTATYVHVTAKNLDYEGFFGASSPGRVPLSAAAWKSITTSAGPNDPVKVDVTKISGADVTGPITETWTIAQGNLKGTVYYNTYSSAQTDSGAVMRIKPGANADVLSAGCSVCHAVSANGNVLVSMGGPSADSSSAYMQGFKTDLTTGQSTPRSDPLYGFGGVFPDGSLLLTNAALAGSWPPNVPGVEGGPRPSALLDLASGQSLNAQGLAGNMLMPSFSPDGKKVAFNHYDATQGHTLATLDFDVNAKAFSNLTDVVTDNGSYLGWPAFLPDAKSFVFHAVDSNDYATWQNHHADLSIVDLATKTRVSLDAANGVANGQPYIPYGSDDLHLNYEPTVLPLAVGGYYWVVFTSRRRFGNTITGADPWMNADRKKLWVVAIDMNPQPGKDPSHPPFYLEGQALTDGNMRGFWALDPCKQNGNSCESGDECCNGFCRQVNADGGSQLVCVPPPSGCANEFEKCNTTADCCGAPQGVTCIAGHCASPTPK